MTSKEFLTIIKQEANPSDYKRYLRQLIYKKITSDDKLAVFEVPNRYIASWIKSKYKSLIQHCFEIYDGTKPDIEIKIAGEKKSKKEIISEKRKVNLQRVLY